MDGVHHRPRSGTGTCSSFIRRRHSAVKYEYSLKSCELSEIKVGVSGQSETRGKWKIPVCVILNLTIYIFISSLGCVYGMACRLSWLLSWGPWVRINQVLQIRYVLTFLIYTLIILERLYIAQNKRSGVSELFHTGWYILNRQPFTATCTACLRSSHPHGKTLSVYQNLGHMPGRVHVKAYVTCVSPESDWSVA